MHSEENYGTSKICTDFLKSKKLIMMYFLLNWILILLTIIICCTFSLPSQNPTYCSSSKHSKNKDPSSFLDETSLPPCSNPNLQSFKEDGRSVMANAKRPNGLFPTWINVTLARKGQKFALDHIMEMGLSHLYGLLTSGYPDGSNLLMFSRQCDNKEKCVKRYLATLTQVFLWYQDPKFQSNISDIITSLSKVRSIHTNAAKAAAEKYNGKERLVEPDLYKDYTLTSALSGAFFKDLQESDIPEEQRTLPPSHWTNFTKNPSKGSFVPMNQQMAALTQYCFMGYPILFPERIGIIGAKEEDIWAFNHLWAVLGYAIGIEDEYNIALQPDLETAKSVYKTIFESFNVPNLFNMDQNTIAFMEITLEANLAVADAPVPPNFFLYRILTDLLKIKAPNTFQTLSPLYQIVANLSRSSLPGDDNSNRAVLNVGLWSGIYLAGIRSYGPEFARREYRAKNVYVSQYA